MHIFNILLLSVLGVTYKFNIVGHFLKDQGHRRARRVAERNSDMMAKGWLSEHTNLQRAVAHVCRGIVCDDCVTFYHFNQNATLIMETECPNELNTMFYTICCTIVNHDYK